MIITELVAQLSLQVDTKALDNFQQKLGNLSSSLITLGAPVAAAAGTLFGFAKMTADAGDEAIKTSQKIGVNVETLQELQHAAGLADLSNEGLATGLKFLNKNIYGAIEGGKEQIKTFKTLGVSFKGTDGQARDAGDVLKELSDTFSGMEDGPKKTALAMEVFGKAGAEMIPFLNSGSKGLQEMAEEARAFGTVISEDSAKLSEEFNDNLTRSTRLFAGIRNMVGAKLIPIINGLNLKFLEFVKANRVIIAQKIEKFFGTLGNVVEKTWKFFTALYDSASGIAEVFGGLENVITAAAYAFAIFAGAKVLFSIGQMVGAIANLSSMFTMLNLKALLIPILIGAAVVALGLIIEDIVAFFQGKDSVTGVILQKFQELFGKLSEGFDGMGSGVKTFVAILLTPFRMITAQVQNVIDLIQVLRGKMSVGDLGKNFLARMKNTVDITSANDSLKSAMGFVDGSAPGAKPTASEVSPGSGVLQNNNVQTSVTVNMGDSSASPMDVGREVGKAVNSPMDNIFRGAGRSFAGAGGY